MRVDDQATRQPPRSGALLSLGSSPAGANVASSRGSADASGGITQDVRLHTLEIDPDGMISAAISGQLGGRHVDLHLRFHFRGSTDRPVGNLRTIALAEIQQVLRCASNVVLEPELGS